MPAQQGQVQAHTQRRMLAGEGHGFLKSGLVRHQAGSSQNALAVGTDDGLVNGGRTAEVVSVDDKAARLPIWNRPPRCHNWEIWRRTRIATRSTGLGVPFVPCSGASGFFSFRVSSASVNWRP